MGYVGSLLDPKLLKAGYKVRVFDLYLYSRSKRLGEDIFGELVNSKNFEQLKGDDGVRSLVHAFQEGKILNSVGDPIYFNIALIKQLKLK